MTMEATKKSSTRVASGPASSVRRRRGGNKKTKKGEKEQQLSPEELAAREAARQREIRAQLLERLKKLKFSGQLPDYFKRIHFKSDEEMVDGYKLVEVFTRSTTDHDIRRLHTVFCSEMTVDLTLLLILEEEKKRRRVPAPGYLADGTPTKDIFTRLDKLEVPLNDPENQETFFHRRNVVVYKAMTPKVVRNAWEAPVELDLRPYVAAAKERIIETVAAVSLSQTVHCPLCGIPPPCSHRDGAQWLFTAQQNRRRNHRIVLLKAVSSSATADAADATAAAEDSVAAVAAGGISSLRHAVKHQKAVRESTIPPWVAQIKHAYESKPSTWAQRKRREARLLKRNGPVRVDCNRKLNIDPDVRWIPPEYRDHPMLQPKPKFELMHHIERYNGSLGPRAMKYNYNHVLHNHDPQIPGGVPSTTRRCENCTLPLPPATAHKVKVCDRCRAARPSLAIPRRIQRSDPATLFRDYCIEERILQPP